MLYGCLKCKENSVVRKVYVRKTDGETNRVEFCINKGCGYRRELPFFRRLMATAAMLLIVINTAHAAVDMNIIKHIESKGNPKAYNVCSGARGLYQITLIVLKEWNNYHRTEQYTKDNLYISAINYKIAHWYLNVRIPEMLRYYKKPLTINNILISYNAGINYVVCGKTLPKETINYINNYKARAK